MLKLFKSHPIAVPGFLLALVLVTFFCGKLTLDAIYWADPKHRDVAPQAWMTPRYIAHSWGIPPKGLHEALNFERPEKERPTLSYIAKARGITVDEVITEVEAYLAANNGKRRHMRDDDE